MILLRPKTVSYSLLYALKSVSAWSRVKTVNINGMKIRGKDHTFKLTWTLTQSLTLRQHQAFLWDSLSLVVNKVKSANQYLCFPSSWASYMNVNTLQVIFVSFLYKSVLKYLYLAMWGITKSKIFFLLYDRHCAKLFHLHCMTWYQHILNITSKIYF